MALLAWIPSPASSEPKGCLFVFPSLFPALLEILGGKPDSAMRCRVGLDSKAKRFFLASPSKGKASIGEKQVAGFGCKSPDLAWSKVEIFFDSRAWLDSDCDDDFFSVNGEFTPSRGSTPIHPLSSPLTPRLNNQFLFNKTPDWKPEASPAGRKKLAELLNETSQSEQIRTPDVDEERADTDAKADIKEITTDQPLNSLNATPYRSGASSGCSTETRPTRNLNHRKERSWRTGHCCLLNLQNFGFEESTR